MRPRDPGPNGVDEGMPRTALILFAVTTLVLSALVGFGLIAFGCWHLAHGDEKTMDICLQMGFITLFCGGLVGGVIYSDAKGGPYQV